MRAPLIWFTGGPLHDQIYRVRDLLNVGALTLPVAEYDYTSERRMLSQPAPEYPAQIWRHRS